MKVMIVIHDDDDVNIIVSRLSLFQTRCSR